MLSAPLLLLTWATVGYTTPVLSNYGTGGPKIQTPPVLEDNVWGSRKDASSVSQLLQPSTSLSSAVTNFEIKNYRDQVHMTKIKLGTQEFLAAIDTGSSDTWVAETGYKCNNIKAMGGCMFGPTYNKSPTFASTNSAFWTSLGQESAEGVMGTETVTLGGITVKNQSVAIVNKAVWRGDGLSSGLVGLGFASNSATQLLPKPGVIYSPIFTSMHRQGLIQPYFSLALNRMNEGPGSISFGALPTAPIRYSSTFVSAPLQKDLKYMRGGDQPCGAVPDILRKTPCKEIDFHTYTIIVEGLSISSQPSFAAKKMNMVVDSGTPHMTFAQDIAKAFNAGWTPAAKFDQREQSWLIECTAKPPTFGVKINGTTFSVDAKDLVIPNEKGTPGAPCTSAVQAGPPWGGGLLGAVFLKNVVAVFDVGPKAEMRFAARVR
jgi:hypothetical protein